MTAVKNFSVQWNVLHTLNGFSLPTYRIFITSGDFGLFFPIFIYKKADLAKIELR